MRKCLFLMLILLLPQSAYSNEVCTLPLYEYEKEKISVKFHDLIYQVKEPGRSASERLMLGIMYRFGITKNKDFDKSRYYFNLVNDDSSKLILSLRDYYIGSYILSCDHDIDASLVKLKQSADNGSASSKFFYSYVAYNKANPNISYGEYLLLLTQASLEGDTLPIFEIIYLSEIDENITEEAKNKWRERLEKTDFLNYCDFGYFQRDGVAGIKMDWDTKRNIIRSNWPKYADICNLVE